MGRRWKIEDMHEIADGHGGQCLSKTYTNLGTKLRWKCAKGHSWKTIPGLVVRGSWCPECVGRRWKIEDMHEIAKGRGGQCLSKTYTNLHTKLRWKCAKGHSWKTIPGLVVGGSWCPECAGRMPPRKGLAAMRAAARARGGRCLSKSYRGTGDEYEWECAEGHRWSRSWHAIKSGRWCARCRGHFPPDEAFAQLKQIARDRGGHLLSKRFVSVKTEVEIRCKEGHTRMVTPAALRAGRWCSRCAGTGAFTPQDLRELAVERGGELVSKRYVPGEKVRWRCAEGHVWSAYPKQVKHTSWCPTCAHASKYTLEDLQEVARSRGGTCLSKRFRTISDRLRWRCGEGHEWTAKGSQIVSTGTWCAVCAGNAHGTINQMRELARTRGGKCLSRSYVDSSTNLRWRCAQGHEWDAIPARIKQGGWCPGCAGNAPGSIEQMRERARARGGKCLSRRYVNANTKLRWRCAEGHEWEAPPANIGRGSWCRRCSRKKKGSA